MCVLEKGRGNGVEGTLISGVGTGWCGLEERASGETVIGTVEVSSGTMWAKTGVAESHLGYGNTEGLRTLRMIQDGRIQGNHQLEKETTKLSDEIPTI